MSRLKRIADRPRENRKKVSYDLSLSLEVDNSDGTAIDDLKKFKGWVTNKFTQWDKSILEYFLYEYGMIQSPDDDKYFLDFKIESLLDDDTDHEHKNATDIDNENSEN